MKRQSKHLLCFLLLGAGREPAGRTGNKPRRQRRGKKTNIFHPNGCRPLPEENLKAYFVCLVFYIETKMTCSSEINNSGL